MCTEDIDEVTKNITAETKKYIAKKYHLSGLKLEE